MTIMKFKQVSLKADPEAVAQQGWVATNADGVAVVKNSKGEFELWSYTGRVGGPTGQLPLWMTDEHLFANYPKSSHGAFDTFEAACREAECSFDVIVPAS